MEPIFEYVREQINLEESMKTAGRKVKKFIKDPFIKKRLAKASDLESKLLKKRNRSLDKGDNRKFDQYEKRYKKVRKISDKALDARIKRRRAAELTAVGSVGAGALAAKKYKDKSRKKD